MDDVSCPARPWLSVAVSGASARAWVAAEAVFAGRCLGRMARGTAGRRQSPAATKQSYFAEVNEIAVLSRPVGADAVARCRRSIDRTANTGRCAEEVSPVPAIGRLAYDRRRDGGRRNARRRAPARRAAVTDCLLSGE